MGMDMDALKTEAGKWLEIDRNQSTRRAVEVALREGDERKLQEMFSKRLKFGTAGLRGRIAPGWNGMNDVTIVQTSQGLVKYVQEKTGKRDITVVVGYDARYNSDKWAKLVATACHLAGGSCYLYSSIVPTPMVPFGVTTLKADVGVMITASHNPKDDNGYKVYWSNGVQIIPPHDAGIEASILSNLRPWDGVWDTVPPVIDPLMELQSGYLNNVKTLCRNRIANSMSKNLFAYTPVHGVGRQMVEMAFRMFGLPAPLVPESQGYPDPAFPTAPFPNPEEPNVLNEVMKVAEDNNLPVVLANDPDADRLALAERRPDGTWKVFSGNELGALLGAWCWKHKPSHAKPSSCYMLASRVSSRFLASMAAREGFNFASTLTGFKWIGNKAKDLQSEGYTVLFGFEEAIGYMPGATNIFDKDGVSTAALLADMAVTLYNNNNTFEKYLSFLYSCYGWHVNENSYFLSYDPDVTHSIFKRLRNFPAKDTINKNGRKYPKVLGGYELADVEDVDVGTPPLSLCVLRELSQRSSMWKIGEENKIIRYYSELISTTSKEDAEKELASLIKLVISEWFQPERNGLKGQAKL